MDRRIRALRLLTLPETESSNCRRLWLLEQAIYRWTLQQQMLGVKPDYEAKVRQMAWNLRQRPVLLDEYPPDVLVALDDATLAAGTDVADWKRQYDLDQRRQHVLLHEEHKVETGGALMCNRCHSRDVSVHQQQTRSADEGMTVFCTCDKCGMRWRM